MWLLHSDIVTNMVSNSKYDVGEIKSVMWPCDVISVLESSIVFIVTVTVKPELWCWLMKCMTGNTTAVIMKRTKK